MPAVDMGEVESAKSTVAVGLLILQSTSFCNINCSYCYLAAGQRQTKSRMGESVLQAVASKVIQSELVAKSLRVLWHCGEPLVCSREYYRNAIAILKSKQQPECQFDLTVQTNATLVDELWCDFFREFDFGVGVSLDGPAFLHDLHRRTWSGAATHEMAMRGAKLLLDRKVRTGAISVVTRQTLSYPEEFFAFFVDNGFDYIGLNIEEIEGFNSKSSLFGAGIGDRQRIDDEARNFYTRLFRAWKSNGCRPVIREFVSAISRIAAARRSPDFYPRAEESTLGAIVSVSASGEVSTFSPELVGSVSRTHNNFVAGNILDSDLHDLLHSDATELLHAEIQSGLRRCRSECSYFRLCGGEFVSNKYAEHGTFDASFTGACSIARRALIDSVLMELA